MRSMYCLGVDIGSSYLKTALLDLDNGQVLDTKKAAVPAKLPSDNELIHEIPAEELWHEVRGALEGYMHTDEDIQGVIFSTQMHGFVLSDPAYGQDIYVSWQDARCLCQMPGTEGSYLEHLRELISPEEMRSTGVYFKPALGVCNLYTLIKQRGMPPGPSATLYTLGSYLISRMTGNNICHITNAAPLGLVDISTGEWRRDILDRLGLNGIALPKLVTDLSPCGQWQCGKRSLQVFPDVGDVQASVYGCEPTAEDMIVNMATAGQVIMVKNTTDIGQGDASYYEVRPYFDGKYCHMISRMPSGRNLDVLIDFFREVGQRLFGASMTREEVWQRVLPLIDLEDAQRLEVDVSFYELPEKLSDGAIRHIDRSNLTIENLLSAALKDVGGIYARYIAQVGGGHAKRLVFCGGAVRNNPLLQTVLTQAVGLPGFTPTQEDEVYQGLLKLSQAALQTV